MRNESLCSVVIFFESWQMTKLKFVFNFHFFNESKHGKDFCALGPFKGMNKMA